MTLRPWLTFALAAAVFTFPLTSHAAPPALKENETIKLASGRTVRVLSISEVEYSKGVMALLVRYETTLTIDERKALSEEVDEFWKLVVKDAEKHNYSEAVISSNEVPKGLIVTANHTINFLYEKGSDGTWTRLNRAEFMAAQ